jgi:hypothetical protein
VGGRGRNDPNIVRRYEYKIKKIKKEKGWWSGSSCRP